MLQFGHMVLLDNMQLAIRSAQAALIQRGSLHSDMPLNAGVLLDHRLACQPNASIAPAKHVVVLPQGPESPCAASWPRVRQTPDSR